MAVELQDVKENKNKAVKWFLRFLAFAELQRKGVIGPIICDGDCLEGAGIKNGKHALVQFGYFDYQPGDIVLFQDLEGHVMIKEFDHWLSDCVAVMRTRYLDPAKDFKVITIKSFIYGKLLR